MKERPILFSGSMVRAILEGRKTQTRRVVKPELKVLYSGIMYSYKDQIGDFGVNGREFAHDCCPYGKIGDSLWVKETWRLQRFSYADADRDFGQFQFRADWGGDPSKVQWKSPIFMPRLASRILLEVTDVRVERLQDISEADAKAEGVEIEVFESTECSNGCAGYVDYASKFANFFQSPIESYQSLWESINGHESWSANPFVWVVEFKRIEP